MGRTVAPKILVIVLGLVVAGGALLYVAASGGPGTPHQTGTPTPGPSQIGGRPTPRDGASQPPQTPDSNASATPLATPSGPPRQRALATREIFGFLPYWKLGLPDTQLPWGTLTTVALFGVEAGKDGKLVRASAAGVVPPGWTAWNSPATTDLIGTAHASHARAVLTVQRFAWTAGQAKRSVTLLSNPAARATLAHEIVAEIAAHKADGVNLDFEPVPAEVADDFLLLVRELRLALDASRPGLQLTFDTTTGVNSWDVAALTADDAADAVFVMGYDYRVAGAAIAGSVDPIASTSSGNLNDTLDAVLAATSPDRVILGLPWYGRAWSTTSDQPMSATQDQRTYGDSVTTEYADAIALASQYGRNYDPTEASAWTVYRKKDCATCPETWRQLWYDDVDSMQAKQKLVLERGVRGLGIWALGQDQALPEVWATLKLTFSGVIDSTPPTGTAKVDPASVSQKHGNLPVVSATLKLALTARDSAAGSGAVFVRVSSSAILASDGSLASGITYPSVATLSVALADPRLGTGFARGQASVSVQWRDVAGNWSAPAALAFWLPAPVSVAVSAPPSPLPSPGG